MGLVQFHAEQSPHQSRVADLVALSQRQRRQLRIEHRPRRRATQVEKEFQILLRGVQHLGNARVVEKAQQGV